MKPGNRKRSPLTNLQKYRRGAKSKYAYLETVVVVPNILLGKIEVIPLSEFLSVQINFLTKNWFGEHLIYA